MSLQLSASHFRFRTAIISVLLVVAAGLAVLATPRLREDAAPIDMDSVTPSAVGPWRVMSNAALQVGLTTTANDINQPYDQTVMRTYVDDQGHAIQVALAWGRHQRQEIKIHRPELCYPAQGLAVESLKDTQFPLLLANHQAVVGKRMIAQSSAGQKELVSYWIRIGSLYSGNAWQTRLHIMQEGLAGRVTDGVLVRVSQRVSNDQDFDAAFARQERFIADLYNTSPAALQHILAR